MDRIKTVELFAGVGGFRLGLEAASEQFEVVWANQWEPSMTEQHAYNCYIQHYGQSQNHVCKDIALVKEDIPEHDLLVGGFPCQDYSIAKKNSKGIEGEKGVLWWQINAILKSKRPKYVLLENVDRLIRSPAKQKGRDFSIILRCLYELGYSVEWRVINAADYGQAQRRRRTFILAYHNTTDLYRKFAEATCVQGLKAFHKQIMQNGVFAEAFPVEGHSKEYAQSWIDEMEYDTLADLLDNQKVFLYNAGAMMNGRVYSVDVVPQYETSISLGEMVEKECVDSHYYLRELDLERWKYAKGSKREKRKRKDGRTYYFTEGAVAFPDALDKPARTMLTSESQVGRSSHVVRDVNTDQLRTLTPIECERLNGFPDNWTNTGMPEKMRYFMMGNALVVPLVTRIGKALVSRI